MNTSILPTVLFLLIVYCYVLRVCVCVCVFNEVLIFLLHSYFTGFLTALLNQNAKNCPISLCSSSDLEELPSLTIHIPFSTRPGSKSYQESFANSQNPHESPSSVNSHSSSTLLFHKRVLILNPHRAHLKKIRSSFFLIILFLKICPQNTSSVTLIIFHK